MPHARMSRVARVAALAAVLSAGTAWAETGDTLYADLGGAAGVARLVEATTNNFLADDRIKAQFEEVNMPRVRRMLAEKICEVGDGGCRYTGHDMRAAHKGLHLKIRDFNAVVEDLQAAMQGVGIPFATQNRLLARLAPMHRDVVER